MKVSKMIPQVSKPIPTKNNRDPEKRNITHGEIFNNILQGEIRKLRRKDESKMRTLQKNI